MSAACLEPDVEHSRSECNRCRHSLELGLCVVMESVQETQVMGLPLCMMENRDEQLCDVAANEHRQSRARDSTLLVKGPILHRLQWGVSGS